MRTVLFLFEHLPACSLGCYGERNLATAEIDALASQSAVYENFLADPAEPSLLSHLFQQNPQLIFVSGTDGDPVAIPGLVPVAALRPDDVPSADQLSHWLSGHDSPLLCIQIAPSTPLIDDVSELAAHWPAPGVEISESAGASSENAQPFTASEILLLPEWKQKLLQHAAHVQRCDAMLSEWLEVLEDVLAPDDVIILTALSGDESRLPEGHASWLKTIAEPVVHLPLVIHQVERHCGRRFFEFTTIEDVVKLVLHFATGCPPGSLPVRQTIRYESARARGVRTEHWLIAEQQIGSEEPPEPEIRLYAKPQDYWEMHDVSREFPDLIETYRLTGTLPPRGN